MNRQLLIANGMKPTDAGPCCFKEVRIPQRRRASVIPIHQGPFSKCADPWYPSETRMLAMVLWGLLWGLWSLLCASVGALVMLAWMRR